jgi:hypothetical protein
MDGSAPRSLSPDRLLNQTSPEVSQVSFFLVYFPSSMNPPIASENKRRWSALIQRPGSAGTNSTAPPSSHRNRFNRPSSSSGLGSGSSWRSWDIFSASAATPAVSGVAVSSGDSAPPVKPPKPYRRYSLLLTSSKRQDSAQQSVDSHDSRPPESTTKSPFGKAFPSILGLSSLSMSRTSTLDSTDDKDRGRSLFRIKRVKSPSSVSAEQERETSRSLSRARSSSPFSFSRFSRHRDPSPTNPQPIPLGHDDAELSDASTLHPRSTAFSDDESGDDNQLDGDIDDDSATDDFFLDPITERNTERNAVIPPPVDTGLTHEVEDPDPLGEGVNIVVAPDPYFPSTLNSTPSTRGKRSTRRRRTVDPLPFQTSQPVFQRDRCSITITQGDPGGKLGGRRKRRYVVASDLSEESRYAVEWGIGTVLRDGDEMWLVTVVENESKSMSLSCSRQYRLILNTFVADPVAPSNVDKTQKLRSQQEVVPFLLTYSCGLALIVLGSGKAWRTFLLAR